MSDDLFGMSANSDYVVLLILSCLMCSVNVIFGGCANFCGLLLLISLVWCMLLVIDALSKFYFLHDSRERGPRMIS